MEIPWYRLARSAHLLLVCISFALAGCKEDLNTLGFAGKQKFIPLMQELETHCDDLLGEGPNDCSEVCNEQVLTMVELYEGRPTLFTCDCSDPATIYPEERCSLFQERLVVCPILRGLLTQATSASVPSTTPTFFVDGKIPCETARRLCVEDANCRSGLQATIAACGDQGCTDECPDALDVFLTQRKAQGLWQCTGCDDVQEDVTTDTNDLKNWCELTKRCNEAREKETVVQYQPGGTAKNTEDKSTKGGSTRQSASHSKENGARPTGAFCVTFTGLYIMVSVSLSIAFV